MGMTLLAYTLPQQLIVLGSSACTNFIRALPKTVVSHEGVGHERYSNGHDMDAQQQRCETITSKWHRIRTRSWPKTNEPDV